MDEVCGFRDPKTVGAYTKVPVTGRIEGPARTEATPRKRTPAQGEEWEKRKTFLAAVRRDQGASSWEKRVGLSSAGSSGD